MRKNRNKNKKRERIVMVASSVFVLAALTMTGIYMREQNEQAEDNGYTLDFTALENSEENQQQEIAQSVPNEELDTNIAFQESGEENNSLALQENNVEDNSLALQENNTENNSLTVQGNTENIDNMQEEIIEDDLDFMPLEANSGLVEIPGITESENVAGIDEVAEDNRESDEDDNTEEEEKKEERKETGTGNVVVSKELLYSEEGGLLRPIGGEILMPYSMEGSIYFETLDQYKYNPAVIFSAEEGTSVVACAEGKVIAIFENEEIGHGITLELGNGYQVTYGQLKEIQVTLDSYVNTGDVIAKVAAPTKYYSLEGSNLYFEMTKDGSPINPEGLF